MDVETIKEICSSALTSGKVSEWEREFAGSTLDRIEKYGEKTLFSEKQIAVIRKINSKEQS